MTTAERAKDSKAQRLADRRDYRQALIQKRNDIDGKISDVETQIRKIQES